jgi:hypothetical protein
LLAFGAALATAAGFGVSDFAGVSSFSGVAGASGLGFSVEAPTRTNFGGTTTRLTGAAGLGNGATASTADALKLKDPDSFPEEEREEDLGSTF